MIKGIFITGTDTGVGKTIITGLIARYMMLKGVDFVTQKWIQTGADKERDDISVHMEMLGEGSKNFSKHAEYTLPYCFKFPCSPHLAARMENIEIDPVVIERAYMRLVWDFELVLAEGSGGLMVPVNERTLIIDILERLCIPVVLVVRNRLGAINHAILSIEALRGRGIPILGVIFNNVSYGSDPVICRDNPEIVRQITSTEFLGEVPYSTDIKFLDRVFSPIAEKITEFCCLDRP